jgi:DNA adenine methylase
MQVSLSKHQLSHLPLLKWAGGKRWLVPEIRQLWQQASLGRPKLRLVEPFAGGMAVTLGIQPRQALLNDLNQHLINFYMQVRHGLTIRLYLKNEAEYYYKVRSKFNTLVRKKQYLSPQAASMFYFLMRTGFNGLCRFNNAGEFNVPFGQHQHIEYKKNFVTYQEIFYNWQFMTKDFEGLALRTSDFIYADPPYDVEFTQYNSHKFTWQDQLRLANWLQKQQGVVVVSNQATNRILTLYQDLGFKIRKILAPRSIAANGNRDMAMEVLAIKGLHVC